MYLLRVKQIKSIEILLIRTIVSDDACGELYSDSAMDYIMFR